MISTDFSQIQYEVVPISLVLYLVPLTLALGVSAISASWEAGAQCSGVAKVSIERNGPYGTFAGDRPDASGIRLAVAVTFRGTCWAAGSFKVAGGEGRGSAGRFNPSAFAAAHDS